MTDIDVVTSQYRPTFGRVPRDVLRVDPRNGSYPMRAALAPNAAEIAPVSRRWRLLRSLQVDQGNTPWCVAATGKHWEFCYPIQTKTGLPIDQLYSECKKVDGYPNEDGSDGHALMKVYRAMGKVANYFWWAGDDNALDLWLLTKGPVWFGAYWTDSMFQTDVNGMIEVNGELYAGHETLLLGFDKRTGLTEVVNSWGNSNFGIKGRGWLDYDGRTRLLQEQGDACGAVEVRA